MKMSIVTIFVISAVLINVAIGVPSANLTGTVPEINGSDHAEQFLVVGGENHIPNIPKEHVLHKENSRKNFPSEAVPYKSDVIKHIKSPKGPKCTFMDLDCSTPSKDCFALMCYVTKPGKEETSKSKN